MSRHSRIHTIVSILFYKDIICGNRLVRLVHIFFTLSFLVSGWCFYFFHWFHIFIDRIIRTFQCRQSSTSLSLSQSLINIFTSFLLRSQNRIVIGNKMKLFFSTCHTFLIWGLLILLFFIFINLFKCWI